MRLDRARQRGGDGGGRCAGRLFGVREGIAEAGAEHLDNLGQVGRERRTAPLDERLQQLQQHLAQLLRLLWCRRYADAAGDRRHHVRERVGNRIGGKCREQLGRERDCELAILLDRIGEELE